MPGISFNCKKCGAPTWNPDRQEYVYCFECGNDVDKLTLVEYIDAIEKNYPPENYRMLREALDYCLKLLKAEVE